LVNIFRIKAIGKKIETFERFVMKPCRENLSHKVNMPKIIQWVTIFLHRVKKFSVRHASLQDDPRRREGSPHLLHLHDQDQQEQARPRKELSHGHGLAAHFIRTLPTPGPALLFPVLCSDDQSPILKTNSAPELEKTDLG
jgi:hypothetical protein